MHGAVGGHAGSHFQVGSTCSNLLRGARAKDQVAWSRLVELYSPLIRGWCRCAGLQAETIDDVLQEILLSVSNSIVRYRPLLNRGSFRRWLRRITENKIKDHFRRSQQQPFALGGSEAVVWQQQIPADCSANDSEWNSHSDARADAMAALDAIRDQFSEQTWRAFFLVTFRDYTSAEAATELDMTGNAVRLALGRVRRRLHEKISIPPK